MTPRALRKILNNVSPLAVEVCRRLQDAGFAAYVVGGAVRDLLLDGRPEDYDIATSASPDQVTGLFRRVVPTGVKHGTVTVFLRNSALEVTTFRTEHTYTDGRHPDSVDFVGTIGDDLGRRDFTINGMALDPIGADFLDPFEGQRDLLEGLIRAIGNPEERFAEDSLRVLRALRFAAQLNFSLESHTWDEVRNTSAALVGVSGERVRDELNKMIASANPGVGLRLMRDSGALAAVLPELQAGVGVEQRGGHRFDVFEHSVVSCEMAPRENLTVRLSALFHDIGKASTLVIADGERHFHGHDLESAELATQLLRRLRYSNADIDRTVHLIRHHMFNYTPEWSDAAVRRFLARVGIENLEDLFALRQADSDAQKGTRTDSRSLAPFRERIAAVLQKEHALTRKDLALNGHDLLAAGIPPGPSVGVVIDHLFETVLDDPAQNTRERLIEIGEKFFQTRLKDSLADKGL